MLGKLYGIGVGPGDPDLLTIKAVKILEKTEYLCFPVAKADGDSVAHEIVSKAMNKDWNLVKLHMPMSLDYDLLEPKWQSAAEEIAEILKTGKDAAFITLGDTAFFSTFIYLVRKIKNILPELEIEMVPGITAPSAIAAEAVLPLVIRDEKLLIVPAIRDMEDVKEAITESENVVLFKIGSIFKELYAFLKENGLEKNAVVASRLGFEDGFITKDLESLLDRERLDYLTTMIIKKNGLE
ncbi:MAG: precorrin-2 C(20)-methyltransferase [Negativicutes bacterium]|nr:precorrin-2 C(20)-methyltransferase [Negativicutes bacterium]